jgi:lysine biosynthesis protein LysW
MITVSCPECRQQIEFVLDHEIGQQVTCQTCNVELEVIWLFPICFDYLETKEQISAKPDGNLEYLKDHKKKY